MKLSKELEEMASGNSLRINQRRMNQQFYDEDHKNLKTFHLKNQIDNDILVKDEQEEYYDYIQILNDNNGLSKNNILSNHSTFNHLRQNHQHTVGGDDFTANWRNPSEIRRDPQKSMTILNLQSMDETSKQILQKQQQYIIDQKNFGQAFEDANQYKFMLNANNNNNHGESQQSIKPNQKSTFPYNIYQSANKLRQKLISKLERTKLQNVQPIHLKIIDDWASSINNTHCNCDKDDCFRNSQRICCLQKQTSQKKQLFSSQQNQMVSSKSVQSTPDVRFANNFTTKKKIQNLIQSAKNLRQLPIQSTKQSDKRKNSIIQIFYRILLMFSCIKRSIFPTDIKRILVDVACVIFLVMIYFILTIRVIFSKEFGNKDKSEDKNVLMYLFLFVGFIFQLIDLIINSITGFYRKGIYINDPNSTVVRYIKSGFIFDFTSLMMLAYIIVIYEIPIKIFQLVYFVRIISISQNLKRIKMKSSINSLHKTIYKIIINFILFACILHSYSLIWILIGQQENESADQKLSWIAYNQLTNQSWNFLYISSLQSMSSTLLFQSSQANTQSEQIFIVFTQLSSVMFLIYFAFQLRKLFLILRNDKQTDEYTFINFVLPDRKIPESLIINSKQYFKYKKNRKNKKYNEKQIQSMLNILPSSLRDEIIQKSNSRIISKMKIMEIFTQKLKTLAQKHLEEKKFDQGQIVYFQGEETDNNLFFIEKGAVELFYVTEKHCKDDEENYLIFQHIQTGQHFGEFSFFTGMPRESFARCSQESTIYKISRDQFRELLEESKRDKEIFCEIKDDLLLENKHMLISQVCPICKKDDHQALNCSELHYIADKERLILLLNNPQIQMRLKEFKRNNNKFNTWGGLDSVQQGAEKAEENSTLYNKCINDAMNNSNFFDDQRLNQSNLEFDEINEVLQKDKLNDDSLGYYEINNEQQAAMKQIQSMEGFPSKYNLASTEFDQFDKENTNRRKSEHQGNILNTQNTSTKQRSFTKEEEFFVDLKSGTSFLFPGRKDTAHTIAILNNNNTNIQGIQTNQQDISVSLTPSPTKGEELSFFSNAYKNKQPIKNLNNLQNDEQSQTTSNNLLNGVSIHQQNNLLNDFPLKHYSQQDTIDLVLLNQGNASSPKELRNKKKNLSWNLNQDNDVHIAPNQVSKGHFSSNNNFQSSNQINLNQNTNPLVFSQANTNNQISNNFNNMNETNYQSSPNQTQNSPINTNTRRISQTPQTLYQLHKEDSMHEMQKSVKKIRNTDQNHFFSKISETNYSEQLQFQQQALLENQNIFRFNRNQGQSTSINNNIQASQNNKSSSVNPMNFDYTSSNNNQSTAVSNNVVSNNVILNQNNFGNSGSNLVNQNDGYTEQSKLQKQTSTRKRTSSKYNDSQYKGDTDSQNSASQFKKVAKKKKNLTIIQEQNSPLYKNPSLKKSSISNQIINSYSLIPIQFDQEYSHYSQLVPMATSIQFSNNLVDNKKIKAKSIFNSQVQSSLDYLQSQHPQQNGMFGDLLLDQIDQSLLFSMYNEKSKLSQNQKSKMVFPKLSQLIPQLQVQHNFQNLNNQSRSYNEFLQNMNGRLRKNIALKKIQHNNSDFFPQQNNQNQLVYPFDPNFVLQRNIRNNVVGIDGVNKNYNNQQFVSYIPKQDDYLETMREFQFYKPHNNVKIILKQIENSHKNTYKNRRRLFQNEGNSFYQYSQNIKQNKQF